MRLDIETNVEELETKKRYAERHGLGLSITDFAFPDTLERPDDALQTYTDTDNIQTMHGPFFDLNPVSRDENIAEVARNRIGNAVDIAEELDIDTVVFHTNYLPLIREPTYRERWIEQQAGFWKELLTTTDRTILLENMWDRTPDHLVRLFDQVDSEQFQHCLDIGHWNIFAETELDTWFEALSEHIGYLHLNDNEAQRDADLALGEGTIDWHHVSELAQNHDVKAGLLEMELHAAQQSQEYIEENQLFLQ